jgi:ABC-type uncharacterized transport system permease subunit
VSFFLELLINGLSVGAVYALIALGFVIIFKATEVINFAHGSLLLLGGYTISELTPETNFYLALLVGLTVTAIGALFIERVLALRIRTADKNTLAIMTIGFDVVLTADLVRRIGVDPRSLFDPWKNDVVQVIGVSIPLTRVVAIGAAFVLLTAFFLAFKYTTWGVAMRASAEDAEAATLMGIAQGVPRRHSRRAGLHGWCARGRVGRRRGRAADPGLQQRPGVPRSGIRRGDALRHHDHRAADQTVGAVRHQGCVPCLTRSLSRSRRVAAPR